MSGAAGNGRGGPRRSDGFGPFHALGTLTDVQLRGMETASEVIKGFIEFLDVGAPPRPADPDVAPMNDHEPGFAQLRINVARALDLYTDLVRRSFESYADLVEQTLRARGVQLNGADDGQPGCLTMQGTAAPRRPARCGCTTPPTGLPPPSCASPISLPTTDGSCRRVLAASSRRR
jgi:hypothetical protein